MKLGNRGWGTKEMIIMTSILFFLLLVVTYYIYAFYNHIDNDIGVQYFELEGKLQAAAIKYAGENTFEDGKITSYRLQESGYLDEFKDNNGKDCYGYVDYNEGKYNPYIKCENYTSNNY